MPELVANAGRRSPCFATAGRDAVSRHCSRRSRASVGVGSPDGVDRWLSLGMCDDLLCPATAQRNMLGTRVATGGAGSASAPWRPCDGAGRICYTAVNIRLNTGVGTPGAVKCERAGGRKRVSGRGDTSRTCAARWRGRGARMSGKQSDVPSQGNTEGMPTMDPTGVPNLDQVLGAGIPRGALVIVVGPPGSGKTTIANQMAFAAARSGRKAMVLTALSEPTSKLIAHLCSFRFYDDELVGDSIVFMSLQQYLAGGLEATGDELVAAARRARAGFVVLDGFRGVRGWTWIRRRRASFSTMSAPRSACWAPPRSSPPRPILSTHR